MKGEVWPHGGEFFLHGLADDFGVVVEEAEEVIQISDARHVEGEYHRWGVACKTIVCPGARMVAGYRTAGAAWPGLSSRPCGCPRQE